MSSNYQQAIQYAQDCLQDVIPSCIYVKKACQRFLNDLENPKYYYDAQSVYTVIKFINFLDLSEQEEPKKFILEPWQIFIVANLYGLKRRDNNKRKYRYAYTELARKNGKSQLVTALAMYHLIVDKDAQVIVSANSLRQAKDVDFKKLKQFAVQLDRNQKHIVHYYNSLKLGTNELIVTASDSKKLDGLNASFCLIDELHEAPSGQLYNVLKSSMGSRPEPLFITITTAGFSTESFCYSLRSYIVDILFEQKEDEQQFGIIYTVDEEDNVLENPDCWIKANPNLGVSVNEDFLQSEVVKAVNNDSEKNGIMVKNFNKWLKSNSLEQWLDEKWILEASTTLDINNFKGQDCIVGVDLASVSDITAVNYLFVNDDYLYFFNRYYIPEDNINTNINRELFKEAASLGYLTITSGNVTDYDYILADIVKQNESTPITMLYYDKYNASQFVIDATDAGIPTTPFSQTPGALNAPIKQFERLIKSQRIKIDKNDITKWMFNNVQLDINRMGNYSISKASRSKKVDGVAAVLNSLGGFLENPQLGVNVW